MKKSATSIAVALFVLLTIAPAIAGDPFTVVVGGLQFPRGLTFGPGVGCMLLKPVQAVGARLAKSRRSVIPGCQLQRSGMWSAGSFR
jgi:hypothetical protein